MRKILIIFGLILAMPAMAETCGLQEYLNNTTCTTIDTGFYGVECTESPTGYTRLEYIEADGASYIDTGFYANQDSSIEISVKVGEYSRSGYVFYGAGGNGWQDRTFESYIDLWMQVNYGGVQVNRVTAVNSNDKYTIKTNKNEVFATNEITNKQLSFTLTYKEFTTPTTVHLLGYYRLSMSQPKPTRAETTLYYAKLWDDETLVRDMIPVQRNSDLEVGLYDLVNDVFYENNGDGEFIPGPASNCAYQLQCTPGFYCVNGVHMYCPIGKYVDIYGATECPNCINAPDNSRYTARGWQNTDCPWVCIENHSLTVSNTCGQLCTAGATSLRTSTGVNVPLFASKNTTPSINIGLNGNVCYADLLSGQSAGAINVKYNGQTYHTVAQ